MARLDNLTGRYPSNMPIDRSRPPRGPLQAQKKPGQHVRAGDPHRDQDRIGPMYPLFGYVKRWEAYLVPP